ncbi:hypothetical protein MMC13_003797 [Lambiella insularis]|nr:hypothetical protein [Lambiella insularis]
MLSVVSALKLSLPIRQASRPLRHALGFSSHIENNEGPSDDDQQVARKWLASYSPTTVPRRICNISFSRSSGPGGQNVNKTNSKATLRLSLKDLLPIVPSLLHQQLQMSRYYAPRSDSIVIQSDTNRKQADNVQECYKKLEDLLLATGKTVVRGETTLAQLARVKKLQRADDEVRIKTKKMHSSKKSSRKGYSSSAY